MASNQSSAARRMRERDRQRKRREKLMARQARRAEKAEKTSVVVDDPMDDPSIDWGEAVRETKLDPEEFSEVEESGQD